VILGTLLTNLATQFDGCSLNVGITGERAWVDQHASGAQVVFRELLDASWLAHAFAFVSAILELYRAPNVSCM
jgi:hypothetical protein